MSSQQLHPGVTDGVILRVGECRPVHQILTLFRPKNIIFYTRSQTRFLKSKPFFRPGLKVEIMSSFLRLERKQKIFQMHFRTRIFLLLRSYSFRIGTTNTFIHFRSSLENHTRFQTKQKQKGKKTNLCGGTNPYGLHREVPLPPPPPLGQLCYKNNNNGPYVLFQTVFKH